MITVMSAPSQLVKLKNANLHALLSCIGSKNTGTKATLLNQLQHDIRIPKLAWQNTKSSSKTNKTRILSVDMGIKNLAFCVCDVAVSEKDVKSFAKSRRVPRKLADAKLDIAVIAWKRIAVTGSMSSPGKREKSAAQKDTASTLVEKTEQIGKEDLFSPPSLSKTAYKLVKDILLPYAPNTILIERQRFRSGGSSAIQEWTVRVNMLESMIWAILTALRQEQKNTSLSPDVRDVNPMKVASFWIGDALKAAQGGQKKVGRAKVEKKQKVELVQRWIARNVDRAGAVTGGVNLTFTDDATKTKDAFVTPRNGNESKTATETQAKKKTVAIPALELSASSTGAVPETTQEEPNADIGKLDDLADCLLQAAAWAKWEQNRTVLQHMMDLDEVEQMVEWAEGSREVYE